MKQNATSSMAGHFSNSTLKWSAVQLEMTTPENWKHGISLPHEVLSTLTKVSFLSLHPKLRKIYLTCLLWKLIHSHKTFPAPPFYLSEHSILWTQVRKKILSYTALNTNQTLEINTACDIVWIFYWTLNCMEDIYIHAQNSTFH